jgi:Ser/Thr protein kinase RdoA (MazF antagonist)
MPDQPKTRAEQSHPYDKLTPDIVLNALDSLGLITNGSLLALNSYENRVYQVGLEAGGFCVVKFYRPARWPDAAIREEHEFAFGLAAQEIPVVAPLLLAGDSLHEFQGFRLAVYPRKGGRSPDLSDPSQLVQLGRLLGRIHAYGAIAPFQHRPTLTVDNFGYESISYLLNNEFIPPHLLTAYTSVARDVMEHVVAAYTRAGEIRNRRLHGDFHPGNLLWTEQGPHIVDLDDCRMGPAIQDLWMLLSGERHEMEAQLSTLLEGYSDFYDFDPVELQLLEALRSLRLIHYSAWLARRCNDPAFPRAFPWFNSDKYWEEQVLVLREQLAAMQEPALTWF